MYYQPENSGIVAMRNRIYRQSTIQTDLELSETSDTDSMDSFDARATVRDVNEGEDDYNTLLLSETSPNARHQILGPVSDLFSRKATKGTNRDK